MSRNTLSAEVFKRPHAKTNYCNDDMNDLARCVDDPLFFIRTFMRIQHPTRGALPFIPYEYQERAIMAFHTQRFVIGMMARQNGKTTCASAYLLWRAMFVPDTTILITANKYVQALEVMDRIRYGYENLPDHIRAGATEYNKGSVGFDNGSRIISRATSSDAGRGLSITLLYCLAGDTTVKVRNKITGFIETISLEALHDRLGQSQTTE